MDVVDVIGNGLVVDVRSVADASMLDLRVVDDLTFDELLHAPSAVTMQMMQMTTARDVDVLWARLRTRPLRPGDTLPASRSMVRPDVDEHPQPNTLHGNF
jgi:hypothetical protein